MLDRLWWGESCWGVRNSGLSTGQGPWRGVSNRRQQWVEPVNGEYTPKGGLIHD